MEWVSDSSVLIPSSEPLALFERLRHEAAALGLENLHPAYAGVLVDIDPARIAAPEWLTRLRALAAEKPDGSAAASRRAVDIPVDYGGESGPDLEPLAARLGLSADELVREHSGAEYTVAFLGFSPGFPYLKGLPARLRSARLPSPRVRVPAGSVAVAGDQAGIYPADSPGGWQILGRTPVELFSPFREPPTLLQPGDRVRFKRAGPAAPPPREPHPGPPGGDIEMIQPGMFTLVQDLGRPGWAHLGVARGGAADPLALRLGNALVGNPPGAAALEMLPGTAVLRFENPTWITVTGADAEIRLDGRPWRNWQVVPVGAGQELTVERRGPGLRSYLCIRGGVRVPPALGSLSTHVSGGSGGFGGRPLKAGDSLAVNAADLAGFPSLRRAALLPRQIYESGTGVLRVTRGPQWDWFTREARDLFFATEFRVAPEADRSGLRLLGAEIARAPAFAGVELASEGVANGSVQLATNGQPMILFCEQGTTGGYPKIASVIRADWPLMGQLAPGDPVRFREVTVEDAWRLLKDQEETLQRAGYGI